MTDRIHRLIPWAALVLFFAAFLAMGLGGSYQALAEREQQQIFLYDQDFFRSFLPRLGGLGIYLGQYLVQFFLSPLAGLLITATALTVSAALTLAALSGLTSDRVLPLVGLAPVLVQGLYLQDVSIHYHQLVAFLVLSALVYGYTLVSSRLDWITRSVLGAVLAGLFFVGFGPMALALSGWMIVWDVIKRSPKPLSGLLSLLTVLLLGFYVVHASWVMDYEEAFSMRMYLASGVEMRFYYTLSVALFSVCPLLVHFMDKLWKGQWRLRLTLFLGLASGLLLLSWRVCSANRDADVSHLNRLMSQARQSEWDQILQDDDLDRNLFFIMIRNLALANKGRLLEDMFRYSQPMASRSLIMDHQFVLELDEVFSMVYEYCSLPAASLHYCQDVYSAIPYGNPTLLKRIIKMKLALADHKVASKYLSFLERSRSYSDWAAKMRPLVEDDAACLKDEEIGRLRRGLGDENGDFTLIEGAYNDLVKVLTNNPSDRHARDYAVGLLLLECDTRGLMDFVERFEGTPVLEDCPTLMQEAILTLSENDLELCHRRGVTDAVIQRYQSFRNLLLQARQGNAVVAAAINREFGSTYWYYLMKKLGMLK